jgi:AbrB family looped-hinge helix DNA binding protein
MRITTKGQVTIPQEFREKLGLLPHTEVQWELDGDSVRLRRARKSKRDRGTQIVEHLRGTATDKRWTTDEIMKMTREW